MASGGSWHRGVEGSRAHTPAGRCSSEGDKGGGALGLYPGLTSMTIAEFSKHLTCFGGHQQAAGIEIPAGELEAFRLAFNELLVQD